MEKGNFMKHYLTVTAALLAFSAQAQVSGPSRPGLGTSPGTFQTPESTSSSIQITTPDSAAISVSPPIVNPKLSPVPRTPLGTPDATGGTLTDSLRSRSTFPSSRDAETGHADALNQSETDARRLTPLPDITPRLPAIQGGGSTLNPATPTVPPSQPAMRTDLNTTGINTPPRTTEKPLDQALSAKIRAQLSEVPRSAAARLGPETIRDLRITTQGGKVILEGNVDSAAQRQLVEMQARQVPGVVAIEDHLNIRQPSVGSPATGQTGQGQLNPSQDIKADHPEIAPDF
jgi:hypothetical protein